MEVRWKLRHGGGEDIVALVGGVGLIHGGWEEGVSDDMSVI